jgi:hypothetical protein
MTGAAHTAESRPEPIVIYATQGFDNYTFSLDIESRDRIIDSFRGTVMPARRVTVAIDTKAAFEKVFGSIEPQVIHLLTGLSPERLQSRLSLEVRNSKTDQVLWRSSVAA